MRNSGNLGITNTRKLSLGLVAVLMPMSLIACATSGGVPSEAELERLTVRGSLLYRQRIALPAGSVASVALSDVSVVDRPADVIASQTIPLDGRQVPIGFELTIDRAQVPAGRRYSLRGTIADTAGRVLWTTDTDHAVNTALETVDLGMLMLVQAP